MAEWKIPKNYYGEPIYFMEAQRGQRQKANKREESASVIKEANILRPRSQKATDVFI
jgi:hypothetical protein